MTAEEVMKALRPYFFEIATGGLTKEKATELLKIVDSMERPERGPSPYVGQEGPVPRFPLHCRVTTKGGCGRGPGTVVAYGNVTSDTLVEYQVLHDDETDPRWQHTGSRRCWYGPGDLVELTDVKGSPEQLERAREWKELQGSPRPPEWAYLKVGDRVDTSAHGPGVLLTIRTKTEGEPSDACLIRIDLGGEISYFRNELRFERRETAVEAAEKRVQEAFKAVDEGTSEQVIKAQLAKKAAERASFLDADAKAKLLEVEPIRTLDEMAKLPNARFGIGTRVTVKDQGNGQVRNYSYGRGEYLVELDGDPKLDVPGGEGVRPYRWFRDDLVSAEVEPTRRPDVHGFALGDQVYKHGPNAGGIGTIVRTNPNKLTPAAYDYLVRWSIGGHEEWFTYDQISRWAADDVGRPLPSPDPIDEVPIRHRTSKEPANDPTHPSELPDGYVECDACRAKPGSPVLCRGCLHNRRAFARLENTLRVRTAELEETRRDSIILERRSFMKGDRVAYVGKDGRGTVDQVTVDLERGVRIMVRDEKGLVIPCIVRDIVRLGSLENVPEGEVVPLRREPIVGDRVTVRGDVVSQTKTFSYVDFGDASVMMVRTKNLSVLLHIAWTCGRRRRPASR